MIWTLRELQREDNPQTCINRKWVPARPENWKYRKITDKIKESYAVFVGRAEAFTWPENQ